MCLGVSDELWCEASRSSVCASKVRRSLVKRCWREAVWSSVLSGQAFRSSVLATRSGQAFWLRNLVMRSCAHTATKRAGVLAPNKQNTLLSTLHVCPRGSSEERLGRLAAAAAAAAAAVVGGGGSSSSGSGGGKRRRRRQLSLRGRRLARWRRRAGRRRARLAAARCTNGGRHGGQRGARVRRHGALKWHTRSVGGLAVCA